MYTFIFNFCELLKHNKKAQSDKSDVKMDMGVGKPVSGQDEVWETTTNINEIMGTILKDSGLPHRILVSLVLPEIHSLVHSPVVDPVVDLTPSVVNGLLKMCHVIESGRVGKVVGRGSGREEEIGEMSDEIMETLTLY